MKLIDLTDETFNRLTVVERAKDHVRKNGKHDTRWLCRCKCDKEVIVKSYDLRKGLIKSCGCYREEIRPFISMKHNLCRHRTTIILKDMYNRCYNKNDKDYKNYGARGIEICNEWNKKVIGTSNAIINFHNWALVNGYSDTLSIDRKNNDGNYEPSNCKWATLKEQAKNKRSNTIIEFRGEKLILKDMCAKYGIKRTCYSERIRRGWTIEEALTTPVKVN